MVERNKYIAAYVDSIIKSFRFFNNDTVTIRINGIKKFIESDIECLDFFNFISTYNFILCVDGDNDWISNIEVICSSNKRDSHFAFQLNNIPSLIELCSKTGISLFTLISMRIISMYISKTKTLYKALVLDLDDTLWNGILSEDGISKIRDNLRSDANFINDTNGFPASERKLSLIFEVCMCYCERIWCIHCDMF